MHTTDAATLDRALNLLRMRYEVTIVTIRAGLAARSSGQYDAWAARARHYGTDPLILEALLRDDTATSALDAAAESRLWVAEFEATLPRIRSLTPSQAGPWLQKQRNQGCPAIICDTVAHYLVNQGGAL